MQSNSKLGDITVTVLKRCLNCAGSGRLMGGGMMMRDCEHCLGKGKYEDKLEGAKLNLIARHPGLSDEDADLVIKEAIKEVNEHREKSPLIKQTLKARLGKNKNVARAKRRV